MRTDECGVGIRRLEPVSAGVSTDSAVAVLRSGEHQPRNQRRRLLRMARMACEQVSSVVETVEGRQCVADRRPFASADVSVREARSMRLCTACLRKRLLAAAELAHQHDPAVAQGHQGPAGVRRPRGAR